jgi:hypothetical protein
MSLLTEILVKTDTNSVKKEQSIIVSQASSCDWNLSGLFWLKFNTFILISVIIYVAIYIFKIYIYIAKIRKYKEYKNFQNFQQIFRVFRFLILS